MKILILDDSVERQTSLFDVLTKLDKDANIFVVNSALSAIDLLKREKSFDIMFLDHDLQPVFMESCDENTGWQVAKYIVDNNIVSKEIVIHSINYYGAQNMLALLPDAKYIPYNKLIVDLIRIVEKWQ